MNVFRRHRERTQAEIAARQSADQASGDGSVQGSIYENMFAQLNAHKTELKKIKSLTAKGVRKGELLDDYMAYVDGILAADEAVQDDVVMTIFIWAIDAGRFETALKISEWALAHDIAPPHGFERSVAEILAEEIADKAVRDKDQISDHTDLLEEVIKLVTDKDMADPVRAKLLKAIGYAKRETEPEEALTLLRHAILLFPKIGVKNDIKALESQIKNSATEKTNNIPTVSPAPVLASDANVTELNPVTLESGSEADGGDTRHDKNTVR